jgi:hypothetical protein
MSGPVYPYREERWMDGNWERDGDYVRHVAGEPWERISIRYGGQMVGRQFLRPVSEKAILKAMREMYRP